MNIRYLLLTAVCAFALNAAQASAETLTFAHQADVQGLDPQALNETFTLGFLGNIYEGLTAYDGEMRVQPALATSWALTSPTTWKLTLRQGVAFHNGNPFTADDVIFTWRRALTEGSDQKGRARLIENIEKVSDHEIIITTAGPVPTLMNDLVFFYIMDQEWAEANGATEATSVADSNSANYANLNVNGTGPFTVKERQSGVRTVLERFDGYWNGVPGNVTEAVFTPIQEDPTRVAALLSGKVHLAYPVPLQDWERINKAEAIRVIANPEARTVYLGMDQSRPVLQRSDVTTANPFADVRVRAAFAHAINVPAITGRIMRGAASPAGLMVAPQVIGFDPALNEPYAHDPEKARALLAEAGYPDGFALQMDCPNDRYVNDEVICQAIVGMLARVGVKVDLLAQTKSKYFAKILAAGGYDTSFYLLAWTPSSMDAYEVLNLLMACRDVEGTTGPFNLGGYCNPEVDALASQVAVETDPERRQALISRAFEIVKADVGYIPLHQQPISWGVVDGVEVTQRADNVLDLRTVTIAE